MKSRFSTYDLICVVAELQRLVGLRVNQVYDIDSKTYLIRLQQNETKEVLLFESGIRIHTTSFEWPKNITPSTFSMKMRKHIKNKRLEKIVQLGLDRIVDMQFGSGEAAYHVIVELFDRGNIILTDYDYITLNVLRPHTEGEDIRFMVREKYPSDRGKSRAPVPTVGTLLENLSPCKPDENLKKALTTFTAYGPALLSHVLLKSGFAQSVNVKDLNIPNDIQKIVDALQLAEEIVDEAIANKSEGYIIQKAESRKNGEDFYSNQEFHPMIFEQHVTQPHIKFASFNEAVDEFFSTMESQKVEMKGVQQERVALKKLENVKKDHEKRISALEKNQLEDRNKAELISRNQELVDSAILAIRQTIASQMSWDEISAVVKEATQQKDPVASVIKKLKLNTNHITLYLTDPYSNDDADDTLTPSLVDIDMDLSAFANAKKYYDHKRQAAAKQQKTLESQVKAFKSAEKKTKQTLKEVKTGVIISKARKVYWFEKFYWFISSENYLVIGGRDQQQNELIVKRYLHSNDIYVHAGITGASSVVIKNPTNDVIPPRTLNEAGTMAMCYSAAWEAKVVTSAWWVNANQVSKTAPTGEYLTTGSFMIRGKKNFLPQCHLIMGFSFMFRLEENSIDRHKNERRKKIGEEEEELPENNELDEVLPLGDDDKEEEEDNQGGLQTIQEQEEQSNSNEYPDFHIVVKRKDEEVYVKIMKDEGTDKVDNEDGVVYLGDDKPVVIKQTKKKNEKNTQKVVETDQNEKKNENSTNDDNTKAKQTNQLKRGQKSKLKKIKEKYKDQDEEERELRMKILHGNKNEPKIKKKDKKNKKGITPPVKPIQIVKVKEIGNKSENEAKEIVDGDSDDETVEPTVTTDVNMLSCLTGQPLAEDELLFAVPVVAPYNALISYKYKVKLTPGTGKRGKASKLALGVFMKDKSATAREKELLKFVKDQDLARNFPGKVKVSAPQLSKVKM